MALYANIPEVFKFHFYKMTGFKATKSSIQLIEYIFKFLRNSKLKQMIIQGC